ncbi:MAG: hypothetical protein Fur0012_04330 [Elusimicrobiota bacterium]
MKKNEDLKAMLEQLKLETSSAYETEAENSSPAPRPEQSLAVYPSNPLPRPALKPSQTNRFVLPERGINPKFNMVWSENKEALLFGMLASVIVLLIGIFSEKEYVSMVGAVSFMLFSLVSFIAFFRYALTASSSPALDISQKLLELERKVSSIGSYSPHGGISEEKAREMEGKIEEIRSVIKTLSRGAGKNI